MEDKLRTMIGAEKSEEIDTFNLFVGRNFSKPIAAYIAGEMENLKSKLNEDGEVSIDVIGVTCTHALVVGMHFYREFAMKNGIMVIDFEKDENVPQED